MHNRKQFMVVEFDWIESEIYRNVMTSCKGIQLVYDILRKYVVRSNNISHKLSQEIFEQYYTKNILASAVTFTHLKKLTGLSNDLLGKCLTILKNAEFIEIRKTVTENNDNQNIYVLGKVKHGVNNDGQPVSKSFWKIDDVIFEAQVRAVIERQRFDESEDI